MNGGKDVRIGDDKRPVSTVPADEQVLYNIQSGEVLTDEFGNPLITEVDTYFINDVTMERSTSVVFDEKPSSPYVREDLTDVATNVSATHADLDLNLSFTAAGQVPVLERSGSTVGVGTTAGINPATGSVTPMTWYNLELFGGPAEIATGIGSDSGINDGTIGIVTNTTDGRRTIFKPRNPLLASPFPIVKTNSDQGIRNNKIYFDTSVGINSILGATVGDRVVGEYIPPATFISNISHNNRIVLSNNLLSSGISTVPVSIRRAKPLIKTADTVWKIAEQFRDSSEVSSTLLGIPRAETQLSLFSNVSSYGVDTNEFEHFTYATGITQYDWRRRYNKIYGRRNRGKVTEETQESGIKLEIFPVSHSYPFPKKGFEKLGWYKADMYEQYSDFIRMGNDLHAIYNSGVAPYNAYPQDWKDSFIPDDVANVIPLAGIAHVDYNAGITTAFARIDTFTDWYRDMAKLGGGKLDDPITGNAYDFDTANEVLKAGFAAGILPRTHEGGSYTYTNRSLDNTRPGYYDNYRSSTILQSRRVFRYQPGRISGFTFGVSASSESRTGYATEWGIKNPTDQYVFRIYNGNISIVRRSTIPLNRSAIERSGMQLTDQKRVVSSDPFDTNSYWTLDIPTDNWLGDPMNGNGPSGHNLQTPNVTMYKIEFGWYGAIGARFYAYVPTGSGGARWVVLHTIVIENSLGQPCLRDSYFRLTYGIDVDSTIAMKEPIYITKYGASYYIDGGDEGTTQIYSISSGRKTISGIGTESLIGIRPKDLIYNSDGVGIVNKKLIIPTKLNVSTKTGENDVTEVKTIVCKGCPGFGHVYTPGVGCTTNGREIPAGSIRVTGSDEITALSPYFFTKKDIGAKVIAPSIYNAYIGSVNTSGGFDGGTGLEKFETAKILGIYAGDTYNKVVRDFAGDISLFPVYDHATDTVTNITAADDATGDYPHAIRLSNFNGIVASNFKFTGSKIEIQFVNPNTKDGISSYKSDSHFADFLIGVTDVEPSVDTATNELNHFIDATVGVGTTSSVPESKILGLAHSQNWAAMDAEGTETQEAWTGPRPPLRMALDYRIPPLSNPAGGRCSKVTIDVGNTQKLEDVSQLDVWPPDPTNPIGSGKHYIRIRDAEFPTNIVYDGGQVGVRKKVFDGNGNPIIDPFTGAQKVIDEATSVNYVGTVQTYQTTEGTTIVNWQFIEIDQQLNGYGTATGTTGGVTHTGIDIVFRPVTASSRYNSASKLFNFDPFPLYLIIKMQDNASVNNISVKETIGDMVRTVTPKLFPARNGSDGAGGTSNTTVNTYGGLAVIDEPPTNYDEIERLSSASLDVQNQQKIREPFTVIDNFYLGSNESKTINMSKIFGPDRAVITPDNNNIEATFLTASIVGGGNTTGIIETSLNFKEQ